MKNFYQTREIRSVKEKVNSQEKGETKKTLSVENYLEPANEKIGENGYMQNPMELFAPYARFKLTLIEKYSEQDKKLVYANLPIKDLEEVKQNTAYANFCIMKARQEKRACKSSPETRGKAYNKKIAIGTFKGMTPASVLLQSAENLQKLQSTADWLNERKENHAGNKEQYEAIMEAIQLYESGQLQADAAQNEALPIEVYREDIKPLKSTLRKDGKQLIYAILIECYPENDMPFFIKVENHWAKCKNGCPIEGTSSEEDEIYMYLEKADWLDVVRKMQDTRQIYINAYGIRELKRMYEELSKA